MKNNKTKRQKLTHRQEIFVEELPVHNWIVYQAGIAAGFSEHYARRRLPQIMYTSVALREAIAKKKGEIAARNDITTDEIVQRLNEIALEAKEKGKLSEAIKANELLGKHLGIFDAERDPSPSCLSHFLARGKLDFAPCYLSF